jgi:hypothetical protein
MSADFEDVLLVVREALANARVTPAPGTCGLP